MKFRRDWKVIYRDFYSLLAGLFVLLLWTIYIPDIKSGDPFVMVDFMLFLVLAFAAFWCYYSRGYFTNIIILSDESITFQQKKQPLQQIRWEDISKIIRTRYIGGKAIVFWDKYGQEIWFYNSRKIENYIRVNQPELEPLFPEENDLRKWQDWNKKLRF